MGHKTLTPAQIQMLHHWMLRRRRIEQTNPLDSLPEAPEGTEGTFLDSDQVEPQTFNEDTETPNKRLRNAMDIANRITGRKKYDDVIDRMTMGSIKNRTKKKETQSQERENKIDDLDDRPKSWKGLQ